MYTKALKLDAENATLYSNRSACLIQLLKARLVSQELPRKRASATRDRLGPNSRLLKAEVDDDSSVWPSPAR